MPWQQTDAVDVSLPHAIPVVATSNGRMRLNLAVARAKKDTVEALAPVYDEVRALGIAGLEIKANGAVYQKRNGILHFHEDETGVQADVKVNGEWQRIEVNNAAGKRKVVALLKRHYAS